MHAIRFCSQSNVQAIVYNQRNIKMLSNFFYFLRRRRKIRLKLKVCFLVGEFLRRLELPPQRIGSENALLHTLCRESHTGTNRCFLKSILSIMSFRAYVRNLAFAKIRFLPEPALSSSKGSE